MIFSKLQFHIHKTLRQAQGRTKVVPERALINNQGESKDKNIFQANDGFTLAELVIASGIMVIISGIVLSIYFPTVTIQKRSVDKARLQQETQLILELLAKDVRNGQIDYGYYGGTINVTEPTLAIIGTDEVGALEYVVYGICFAETGENQMHVKRSATPIAGCDATFEALGAPDVEVTALSFFIKPATDPFLPSAPDLRQPRMTASLIAQRNVGPNPVTINVQTTIPQRQTERN